MQFSTEAVRDLAQLLNETGLHEIAIQTCGENEAPTRIVVRGAAPQPSLQSAQRAPFSPSATPENFSAKEDVVQAATQAETDALAVEEKTRPIVAVTAIAVGLFRPAATALQIGDVVRQGQIVGAVESLKIPNDVASPAPGRVVEILAEDGQGVEYGQPLLMIETEEAA